MKSDSVIKKHHFWILLGLVPLFVFIGALVVNSSVGGEIEAREKAIDESNKKIQPKLNPKPNALIEKAAEAVKTVSSKQGNLHSANWNRQKHLFTWPAGSPLLKRFETMDLKFGDPLPTAEGEFDEFKKPEVYRNEFSSLRGKDATGPGTGMADRITPTQFKDGWERVLRHVDDFGQSQITKDQVWLIMEDIWVQRSMLSAIRSVNEEMAAFRRAKLDKDGNIVLDDSFDEYGNKIAKDRNGKFIRVATPDEEKKKALFRNRTWAIELQLVPEGTNQRLVGTLTNLSDRLQLMGVGNIMTLQVWFTNDPTEQPMEFKIGGEYLAGKGGMKVIQVPVLGPDGKPQKDRDGKDKTVEKTVPANELSIIPLDDHVLPVGKNAEGIVRVRQLFDIRTVPIKRIEALALGQAGLDSRNAAATLVPRDPADEKTGDNKTGDNTPGGKFGPMGPMGFGPMGPSGPMPVSGGRPAGPTFGPAGTNSQQGAFISGGGPITQVIDENKKRYLEATSQVRRLPVGMVIVVDQEYMQDVLMAFANSPLRFQITQIEWTRFRGTLSGTGFGGSANDTNAIDYGRGSVNFGPSSGNPIRPGPSTPPGPITPPTRPGGGPPGSFGPGSFGPGNPSGFGYGSNSSTVSESQITSGLVELSIYGIVSLYEKYTEAPKVDATTPNGSTPGPTPGPTPPTPGPGPMPPAPRNTNTKPKMRRRGMSH